MTARRTGWLVVPAVLAAVVATVVAPAAASAPAVKRPGWPAGAVPGSLLVTTTDGHTRDVRVPAGQEMARAARLRSERGVLAVEPDYVRHAWKVPNDPSYPQQWSHVLARTPQAWDTTTGSSSVTVALIDSGVDGTNPELRPNLVGQVDASSDTPEPVPLGTQNDPCQVGHGTFVAGVLGATGNNGAGVAGVAWKVGILDIAANERSRCSGGFTDSAVVGAIQYAIDQHVDVINLSLGSEGDTCPTAYQTLFDKARAAGISVVAAAGNEEQQFAGATSVPASCDGVLSIGAVGPTGLHSFYSNDNDYVDLAAPGGDDKVPDPAGTGGKIISTTIGGGTALEEGTSFASPYVAGVIALMKAVRPALTPDEAERILEGTTQNAPTTHSATLGWGVVDAAAAVAAASSGSIPAARPQPAPFPVGSVVRVSAQGDTTDAVHQAVAMSRFVFPAGKAQHVVLARSDDFADALAGSSLGFGAGPVLFTASTGPLDATTAAEVQRVLPPGGRVYLLGGSSALPSDLENQLQAMGFTPMRLAGSNRMETAALVAREVVNRVQQLGFTAPTHVLLATAFQWPDAVTAGSLGAFWGYPILLTEPNRLSDVTRAALADLHPQQLHIVGGTSAISAAVATDAERASGAPAIQRLAGTDRDGTAIAVAREFDGEFRAAFGVEPFVTVAVNLRRAGGFTEVLSASPLVGVNPGVFIPVEGDAGDRLPQATIGYVCSVGPRIGIVAGDVDVVKEGVKQQLNGLLERTSGC